MAKKKEFTRDKIMLDICEDQHWILDSLRDGISLDELAKTIQARAGIYGGEACLCLNIDFYDEEATMYMNYQRLETDLEHTKRLDAHDRAEAKKPERAQKAEERRLLREKKALEKLKVEAASLGYEIKPKA